MSCPLQGWGERGGTQLPGWRRSWGRGGRTLHSGPPRPPQYLQSSSGGHGTPSGMAGEEWGGGSDRGREAP